MNETSKWVLKTLREKTPCECCLNSLKELEQNGFPENSNFFESGGINAGKVHNGTELVINGSIKNIKFSKLLNDLQERLIVNPIPALLVCEALPNESLNDSFKETINKIETNMNNEEQLYVINYKKDLK